MASWYRELSCKHSRRLSYAQNQRNRSWQCFQIHSKCVIGIKAGISSRCSILSDFIKHLEVGSVRKLKSFPNHPSWRFNWFSKTDLSHESCQRHNSLLKRTTTNSTKRLNSWKTRNIFVWKLVGKESNWRSQYR